MDSGIIAFVKWPLAPLTERLVRMSLATFDLPPTVISSIPESFSAHGITLVQWSTYDSIDHELTHKDHTVLSSSYIFRKALIRKHFLSRCIHSYLLKRDQSVLKKAIPRTWDLEISYADELDEMWSDELWDLGEELDDPEKWWILKPSMADRGMGIRLFNSKTALQQIFEEFNGDSDDEETEADETAVITSQLRHFVIQEYLLTPLLLDISEILTTESSPNEPKSLQGHKFHLRAYFVASGAITLYMYPRILALFSAVPYSPPIAEEIPERGGHISIDMTPHLTNTSLQRHRGEGVRLLDELVGCPILSHSASSQNAIDRQLTLTNGDIAVLKDQMADVLSETFRAAIENPVHFQPIPNAFELFGVDFLVSHTLTTSPSLADCINRVPFQVQLLEINSEPAIELTGPRLTWILEDLFIAIGKVCITPFFSTGNNRAQSGNTGFSDWGVGETRYGLQKCLEVDVRGPPAHS
ncbi:hypothetical protein PILCRDRAFT_817360 [Piloderma croceum F 1598]|uniref:Tubulin-tyrosine ligase n=1 Tax=Piloderma croceum (strain F 1598) TaxID=765440 RepID=A0A0C3C6Q6_PILCF|nr:hypothetical protein PILCRDRAFT_817360 [Piloderma croceum F 1598]